MTSSGLNMLRFFSFRLFWRWISLLFGFPQAKLVANLFPARVPLLASELKTRFISLVFRHAFLLL